MTVREEHRLKRGLWRYNNHCTTTRSNTILR